MVLMRSSVESRKYECGTDGQRAGKKIWLQGSSEAEKGVPQPEMGYEKHEMKAMHQEASYYQRSIVAQSRKRNHLLKKVIKRTVTLR
jgi:hypothetical protein